MQQIDNEPGRELPPVLTVQQVADYLKLGRTITYQLVKNGTIPSLRLGHQYRIIRDTFLAWLASTGTQEGPQTPEGTHGERTARRASIGEGGDDARTTHFR